MPSLSPLSTSSAWRTRAGTARSSTTRWPSAASVAHSIVDSRKAVVSDMPGNTSIPAPMPAAMVSGRPTSSSRLGQLRSWRSDRRSSRAESLNSRNARASSVIRSAAELWMLMLSHPRLDVPTAKPAATKTIAEVIPRRSSGPETAP